METRFHILQYQALLLKITSMMRRNKIQDSLNNEMKKAQKKIRHMRHLSQQKEKRERKIPLFSNLDIVEPTYVQLKQVNENGVRLKTPSQILIENQDANVENIIKLTKVTIKQINQNRKHNFGIPK